MTLQFGRVTLNDPQTWMQQGETVSVAGWLSDTDINVIKAQRQGLIGHRMSVDEPVIPVTSTVDTTIDGFYRVLDVAVDVGQGGHALNQYQWSATLERVSDYSAPLIESTLLAPTVRTNGSSVADGIDWHAVPQAMYRNYYDVGQDIVSLTVDTEDSGSQSMRVIHRNAAVNLDLEDATAHYYSDPEDWYNGACLLEYDYTDAGDWRTVVGRQAFQPGAAGPTQLNRWRIGNGVLRVTFPSTGTDTELEVSRWLQGSTAYSTSKTFEIGQGTTISDFAILATGVTSILYNSPHRVTLRIPCTDAGERRITLDLTIRRGCPWIEVVFGTSYTAGLSGFAIQLNESETTEDLDNPTAFSGLEDAGIKATSADGDGLFYFISSAETVTLDTTNRDVSMDAAATSGSFAIGLAEVDDNGTSFPTFDSPGFWTLNYLKAMTETVRVVEQ